MPDLAPAWRETDLGADRAYLHTVEAGRGADCLRRTVLSLVDDVDDSVIWRTTIDLLVDHDAVLCAVDVECATSHPHVLPSPLHPRTIALLHTLTAHDARAGDLRVAPEAHAVVGAHGIDHFVDAVLLHPGRRLPVLLFTNIKERSAVYPDEAGEPSLVARELCGIAHVHLIGRTEDSHRLSRRLGALSAYDGAIRIYWPQLQLSDPPQMHPLHLRARLHHSSLPAIIRRIVDVSAQAFSPLDGAGALLASRRHDAELAHVDSMLRATDAAGRETVLRSALMRLMDDRIRLEDEVDALRDEISLLRGTGDPLDVAGVAQSAHRRAAAAP